MKRAALVAAILAIALGIWWVQPPKVLVIGDSISIGYAPFLAGDLKGFNVQHSGENAQTTGNGIERLDIWLRGGPWQIIVFNFGLHDLHEALPPEQYESNLDTLAGRIQRAGHKAVFVETTKVPADVIGYHPEMQGEYRDRALSVMRRHGIPICPVTAEPKNGDVHLSAAGYSDIASQIAACIEKQVPTA